jgi:ferric-dicitrate binding protein FerR (iron transport regulator)
VNAPDDLIRKQLDGIATAEEQKELDRLLTVSPEAAEAFARGSRLDQALDRHYRNEQAIGAIQGRIRAVGRRRLIRIASVAAALLLTVAAFWVLRGSSPIAFVDGSPLHELSELRGPLALTFPGETTRIDLAPGAVLQLESVRDGKHFALRNGSLRASVDPQPSPMILTTPSAKVRVLGTRFSLAVAAASTRLEVTHGKVNLSRGDESIDVGAAQAVETRPTIPLARTNLYEDRFTALRRDLLAARNGYFSPDRIPYHSVETFLVDAPDYGHLSTSETMSYWLWLEAMHGRLTGDWAPFNAAWKKMEESFIPADQSAAGYTPNEPAKYAPEGDRLRDYPVELGDSLKIPDPLYRDLPAELHVMHWLVDVDDFYGYGKRAFVNTFQRGPAETVWKTIPHPSRETFAAGKPGSGFLQLFVKDSKDRQWRYTGAPDADARVLQAVWEASQAVREKGGDPAKVLPLAQAAKMGNALRYALHDKYFKTQHNLIAWSQSWGGSLEPNQSWAWRTGASHIHFGYQNPLAAYALSKDPLLPAGAAADWNESLKRQVEFYAWLQSAEGAISGGATASWKGRYEPVPADVPKFHDLAYVDHPVFPDSNEWFGWQPWSMGRLAEYARVTNDPQAHAVVDKWAAWARSVVKFTPDGGYAIPATLRWSGRPGAGLHVSVLAETQDVGVAASLVRALAAHGDARSHELARELLERIWTLYRDDLGVSNPEERPDYKNFNSPAELPPDWRGALASGDAIRPGATFLDLRPKYRKDPDFQRVEQALRRGAAPVFRYHRFWAQVEVALANAEVSRLGN